MTKLRASIAVLLLLLLAACTAGSAPPADEAQGGEAAPGMEAAEQQGQGQEPGPVQAQRPAIPEVMAETVTDGLMRVEFASGDVIDREGVYFLNTETGLGEGWVPPDNPMYLIAQVTEDNRFIITSTVGADDGYLVDRQTGTVRRWDATRFRLILADARGFLFAETGAEGHPVWERDTGRVIWTGPDLRPVRAHELTDRATSVRNAILSPEGEHLAILLRQAEVVLLDLKSGAVRTIAAPAVNPSQSATLERAGDLLQVTVPVSDEPWRQERVMRFDWDGNQVADIAVPGERFTNSPDGRWATWVEWPVDWLAPVTVVADATTMEPRLQVLGATTSFPTVSSGGSRWLSDSSGLVVDTSDGYRILTLSGELRPVPGFSGQAWRGEPQPAPDDPDRFALGRLEIADGDGTAPDVFRRLGVTLEGFVTAGALAPWGRDSTELRFVLPPKPGGGVCGERPPMEVRVQYPARPLPEYPLVVEGVADCLSLEPGELGKEKACLPNGTRLTAFRPRTDLSALDWFQETWHLWVRTESGKIGRISLEGNPLRWALD